MNKLELVLLDGKFRIPDADAEAMGGSIVMGAGRCPDHDMAVLILSKNGQIDIRCALRLLSTITQQIFAAGIEVGLFVPVEIPEDGEGDYRN